MPDLDLGNRLNWDLVKRQSYTGKALPVKSGYDPIPDISLVLSSYLLLIGIHSPSAKPHWWLGCRASIRLLISPSSTSEFASAVEVYAKNCRLDALTLVEIPRLKPLPYLLVITIPWWHSHVDLEVWQYSADLPEGEQESLSRMSGQLQLLVDRDVRRDYEIEINDNP